MDRQRVDSEALQGPWLLETKVIDAEVWNLCSAGRIFVTLATCCALRAHLIEERRTDLQEWACPNWTGLRRYIFRSDKFLFPFKFCLLGKEKHCNAGMSL